MLQTFKVYLLERSNLVVGVQIVAADSDDAAVEAARRLPGIQNREVWCGERRIAFIDLMPIEEA